MIVIALIINMILVLRLYKRIPKDRIEERFREFPVPPEKKPEKKVFYKGGAFTLSDKRKPTVNDDDSVSFRERNGDL